ncbi:hypothetical protein VPSG_00025 [Vibrio phage pYD38-B]|uniref:hypothetical protein n=1 Tax=Vibrio phage pYD38-B TaxID=929835 RepID=UPI0003426A84|nr:hypothetical protein VPSG_00025 [Vibrio phage pYD38-B]AGN34344.1 hypothetical protein VPSG_00025 [Vibrio phage pYD38-B]
MDNENFDGYPSKQYGRITPRDYQQAAIDRAIEHCKTSSDPAVIDCSVGGGKTILIAALAKHVTDKGGKVLMLTRQSIVCAQNAEDAWLTECRNSLYSAGLGVKSSVYNAIFGTEGTVYNSLMEDIKYMNGEAKSPSKLYDFSPDLLLIDECHHYDWTQDDCQYSCIIKELYRRNQKLKIIGLTGTSYRSTTPIIGESEGYFWKKRLINISTNYLTERNFLVPIDFGFGHDETQYDLSEFKSDGEEGVKDYTKAELEAMEKKILSEGTTTQKIMLEVMEKTKHRNGVMICCAGKKHMKEAAKVLPKDSYAIISDETPEKTRNRLLKEVYDGKRKYVLQQSVLSTGYNCPILDTLVILRKYSSLTLLVQTVGRVLRLLKPEQKEAGIVKERAMVLDYTDTFNELGELYFDPILEEADFSKAKDENDLIQCPKCGTENSIHAVRCRNIDNNGDRCDFFWKSRTCEDFYANGVLKQSGCGAENAPTARSCRICNNTLIDPNENLSRKHYSNTEFKPVMQFKMTPCKNDGVLCQWYLPNDEVAKMFFTPFSENQVAKRIWYNNFVKKFANTPALKKAVRQCRNAGELCQMESLLNTASAITHRIGTGDKSVVSKVIYKEQ